MNKRPRARRERTATPASARETGSAHVTPVGANIFLELGCALEEAAALWAASKRAIAAEWAARLSAPDTDTGLTMRPSEGGTSSST